MSGASANRQPPGRLGRSHCRNCDSRGEGRQREVTVSQLEQPRREVKRRRWKAGVRLRIARSERTDRMVQPIMQPYRSCGLAGRAVSPNRAGHRQRYRAQRMGYRAGRMRNADPSPPCPRLRWLAAPAASSRAPAPPSHSAIAASACEVPILCEHHLGPPSISPPPGRFHVPLNFGGRSRAVIPRQSLCSSHASPPPQHTGQKKPSPACDQGGLPDLSAGFHPQARSLGRRGAQRPAPTGTPPTG